MKVFNEYTDGRGNDVREEWEREDRADREASNPAYWAAKREHDQRCTQIRMTMKAAMDLFNAAARVNEVLEGRKVASVHDAIDAKEIKEHAATIEWLVKSIKDTTEDAKNAHV